MAPATRALAQTRPLVVASKTDAEGGLLGNLILLALESGGVAVTSRLQLGPTRVLRTALLSGDIDLYPEYTGNGAFFFDRQGDPAWHDAAAGYALIRRLDDTANRIVWLPPAPADNTWAIAVRRDVAERLALRDMAGFARAADAGHLRLAASAEFVESPAALPAFESAYDFLFPRGRIVMLPGGDTSATMRAAAERMGGVDCAMVYSTDGALSVLDLVVMTDENRVQMVFQPAPVIRADALSRFPMIPGLLAPVFARLDLAALRRLNALVTVEGRPPRAVAQAFLSGAG
ncbi:MAG: transporter [Rubritepida sp.]|nr:transporter [Rubritepida sp.]